MIISGLSVESVRHALLCSSTRRLQRLASRSHGVDTSIDVQRELCDFDEIFDDVAFGMCFLLWLRLLQLWRQSTIVSFCSWISLGRNGGSAIIVTVVVVVSVVVCSLCATNAVVTSLLNFIESAVAAATVAADVIANDTSVVAGSVSDSRFTSSSNRRETDDANRRNGFRTWCRQIFACHPCISECLRW